MMTGQPFHDAVLTNRPFQLPGFPIPREETFVLPDGTGRRVPVADPAHLAETERFFKWTPSGYVELTPEQASAHMAEYFAYYVAGIYSPAIEPASLPVPAHVAEPEAPAVQLVGVLQPMGDFSGSGA